MLLFHHQHQTSVCETRYEYHYITNEESFKHRDLKKHFRKSETPKYERCVGGWMGGWYFCLLFLIILKIIRKDVTSLCTKKRCKTRDILLYGLCNTQQSENDDVWPPSYDTRWLSKLDYRMDWIPSWRCTYMVTHVYRTIWSTDSRRGRIIEHRMCMDVVLRSLYIYYN